MKVGFDWSFMFGMMNEDRYGGLKVDVMEIEREKLKDEGSLCLTMKEEEERKKIGKRRVGTMAPLCHHRHRPCQLFGKVVGLWLGHRYGYVTTGTGRAKLLVMLGSIFFIFSHHI